MDDVVRQDLFDEWLREFERGKAPEIGDYLAEHGEADPELRKWIEAVAASKRPTTPTVATQRFGDFRLLRSLGEGGMGTVWLAEQEGLSRHAAVKLLRGGAAASPATQERFRREASSLARLRHPSIVQVYGFGIADGAPWLAMEFVEGPTLSSLLNESRDSALPLDVTRVLRWFTELADGLAAAHEERIIHRDVKPSNVIITPKDEARLLDFGIAREVGSEVTATLGFVGSPPYASPEQWEGGESTLDVRTDIWSLGVSLYETLTGRLPFEATPARTLSEAIRVCDAQKLRARRAYVPKDLEVVLDGCLEPARERRYASMQEVAKDLRRLLRGEPPSRAGRSPYRRSQLFFRRHPRWGIAAAGMLLIATGILAIDFLRTRQASIEARDRAHSALTRAQLLLIECEAGRQNSRSLDVERQRLLDASTTRFLDATESARLPRVVSDLSTTRLKRSFDTEEIRALLSSAEDLSPSLSGLREAWLAWYFEKWATAAEVQDRETAIHFRDRILNEDRGGPFAERVLGTGRLEITSNPPGAAVHVFQVHDLHDLDSDEASREVLVGATLQLREVPSGRQVLRVVSSPDPSLRSGDVIFAVEGENGEPIAWNSTRDRARIESGGVRVRAYHDDRVVSLASSAGLQLRASEAAPVLDVSNRIGTTPLPEHRLNPGSYVAVLTLKGHLDRRILFRVPHQGLIPGSKPVVRHAELLPITKARSGFIYVSCDEPGCNEKPFWIGECEVTQGEFAEFLNALGDAGEPHTPALGEWRQGERWKFRGDASFPALGISALAAAEFLAWNNSLLRPEESGWEYALPSKSQWTRAAGLVPNYVFGAHFDPKKVKSRFTREEPVTESTMSFPRDESRWGVFDMTGSAAEWLRLTRMGPTGIEQAVAGGSWRDADPELFKVKSLRWAAPGTKDEAFGFRLVLHPKGSP